MCLRVWGLPAQALAASKASFLGPGIVSALVLVFEVLGRIQAAQGKGALGNMCLSQLDGALLDGPGLRGSSGALLCSPPAPRPLSLSSPFSGAPLGGGSW